MFMPGSEAPRHRLGAFTLLELVVVITIVAALAALVVTNVGTTRQDAEAVTARVTMKTVAEALTGSAAGPGYLADMKHLPIFRSVDLRIHHLLTREDQFPLYDPSAQRGWRGPYLRHAGSVFPAASGRRFEEDTTFFERNFYSDASSSPYGEEGDPAVVDSWGNPVVLQVPPTALDGSTVEAARFHYARIVSAGPDGFLSTPLLDPLGGTRAQRGDDLVVFLNRADTDEP